MKAIVLAGGFGTRLAEVVKDVPKPLAPIGERPFLAILLDTLQQQGVRELVLAVYHLKEKIIDYFGSSYKGMSVRYSEEEKPLGTGGGLQKALSFYPEDEPILCLNGDSFLDISLQHLFHLYREENLDLIVALREVENCERYGQVQVDRNRILTFQYPGTALPGLVNAGIYVLSKKLFDKMDLNGSFSFETEVLQCRLKGIKCGYSIAEGKFIDIGTVDSYKKSEAFFVNLTSKSVEAFP